MKKAVILFSGGLDSTTTLYLARKAGCKCFLLVFNYGQRHKKEIRSAGKIARLTSSSLKLVKITLPWARDVLTNRKKPVPEKLKLDSGNIPSTYVAARNTIFLGFAVSFAESIGAEAIFIGANARDWSGYPDCTPRYFKVWQELLKVGTKAGRRGKKIEIKIPLLNKTKKEIVELAKNLAVPFELTWSCYKGEKTVCGKCDACRFRAKGFKEAGLKDPLVNGK